MSGALSLHDIMLDLCGRFMLDVPQEEQDLSRIVFQIEQAWWYYLDFYREAQPKLPNMALRKFATMMFRYTPYLANKADQSDAAVHHFLKYKHSVPVCGGIILDKSLTKCLLVKGWKSRSTWGFPKGKIDYQEDKFDCAIREVFEETSFDMRPWASRNDYVDSNVGEQETRLYICAGAPLDTEFSPRTRKEIGEIKWHLVDELPTKPKEKRGYYMVYPYVHHIKKFIAARRANEGKEHAASIAKRERRSKKVTKNTPPPPMQILRNNSLGLLPTPVSSAPPTSLPSRHQSVLKPGGSQSKALKPLVATTTPVTNAPSGVFVHCRSFYDFHFDISAIAACLVFT